MNLLQWEVETCFVQVTETDPWMYLLFRRQRVHESRLTEGQPGRQRDEVAGGERRVPGAPERALCGDVPRHVRQAVQVQVVLHGPGGIPRHL